MRIKTASITFFTLTMLAFTGFGADKQSVVMENVLPWPVIAEIFQNNSIFYYNSILLDNLPKNNEENDNNYACKPSQSIIIKLSEQSDDIGLMQSLKVNISEYADGSWHNYDRSAPKIKSHEINIENGIKKEGFFKLTFTTGLKENQEKNPDIYLIVSNNWKKDILTFCRTLKEQIEIIPDSQLIRSTIAVSHFDHVMEMISREPVLSKEIIKATYRAIQSKIAFDGGKYPALVKGLNKIRLKRFEGATIEQFAVFIPENYEKSKKWPVYLYTGDTKWANRNDYPPYYGFIDIWWHTVSHKELRWKEYCTIMSIIKETLNIDQNRIYIYGDCMDGIAAIALALNRPDQWAECSSSLGNSYRHLAGNALNLPLIFVRGTHGTNQVSLTGYYQFALKNFQFQSINHFKTSQTQEIAQVRGSAFPETGREKKPRRVLYTIESLGNPGAYWVKINGREDENKLGTIDALVDGQKIRVKTDNIDAYSLDLTKAPLDANKPVEIIENNQTLGHTEGNSFTARSKKYKNTTLIKNEYLHGPVWNVFTDPYVVVWGGGGNDHILTELNEKIATSLAKDGPCFTDIKMPEGLIETHNLILVGTAQSNIWLSKISNRLPVRIENSRIVANGKSYEQSDMGFILICPNPLKPQKYAAVFSGTSLIAMENINAAYTQMKEIRPADVGIFEVTQTGNIKWHVIEKFNTVWNWHNQWNQVLFNLNKKHPKWQWNQWIAEVLRTQLDVDVVFCEDLFLFENPELQSDITYRNLFNTFRNIWFIKIKTDGKTLKNLCTVSFKDTSKREIEAPILKGISLSKHASNDDGQNLIINELVDENSYTVALPEKCLNGDRTGLVITNYEIIGENYLVPILKNYFEKNNDLDVDMQLDCVRPNVF